MTVNSRPKELFAAGKGPGKNNVDLTFDDITVVNMLVENLLQRQPDGSGRIFAVQNLLDRMHAMEPAIVPARYLRAVVEYLQRLVGLGVLVDDQRQLITEYPGLLSRMYKPGGWIEMTDWTFGSASRAMGLPYVAHVFGDLVVRVHCGDGESEAIGSGVVIANDLLVTNAHVFDSRGAVYVSFGDSERVPAREVRISTEPKLDIAVVEAPGLVPVPTVHIRDPHPAESVIALGYPLVPLVESRPLLRFPGSVSSDGPVDTLWGQRCSIVCSVFSPGSSGGGVFGSNGQLVGLVVQSFQSDSLGPSDRREYAIFHAMIPGGVLLQELKRMHKRLWFLNEFGNDEDLKRREAEGWTETFTRILP